jgi:fructosamine-3-kinase
MVMFFGLTNSLATFQMMMNTIFQCKVQEGWLSIFMDDRIIYTKQLPREMEEHHRQWHQQLVHCIFKILEKNDLYVKLEKCTFKQEEIEYLGVIIRKGKT